MVRATAVVTDRDLRQSREPSVQGLLAVRPTAGAA
jgi:hypothetical protein